MKTFFDNTPTHAKNVYSMGPNPEEQLQAMANGDYWIVLGSPVFKKHAIEDTTLLERVYSFKHALQTFGPAHARLPDLRMNEGHAKKHIYHGHVNDSNGKTYVLEWAVLDTKQKIMILINFGKHENYKFRREPLPENDIKIILDSEKTVETIKKIKVKIKEAQDKVERMRKIQQESFSYKP